MAQQNKKQKQTKKQTRREQRAAAKAVAEERQQLIAQAKKRRRNLLAFTGISTLVGIALAWFVFDAPRITGILALAGGLAFVMQWVSSLGAEIEPKDSLRSGAIDFGGE